jgi:uncharacterized repeat protein (TIGR01451 family)
LSVRRRSLSTAVFLLAAALPRCGSAVAADPAAPPTGGPGRVVIATSAPAPAPAPTPASPPAAPPTEPKPRLVIATSVPQPLPHPVVPVPDDGLKPLPRPTTEPAAPTPQALQLTSFREVTTVPKLPEPSPADTIRLERVPVTDAGPTFHAVPASRPVAADRGRTASVSLETIGPASHAAGRPFTYEIVVRNPGTTPAAEVHVREQLPEDARCLRTEPAATAQGPRLEWDLGDLDAGAERRLRVEVEARGEGPFRDRVTATCSVTQSLATVIRRPRLALTMTAPAQARLGEEVAFQVCVANNGTGPASHVLVHDRLPAGLEHAQGGDVEADVGTLAPGESKTITLRTRAVRGGRHLNEAVARADDGLEAPASAAVQVEGVAALTLEVGDRDDPVEVGAETTYEVRVRNQGTGDCSGVRVEAVVPDGMAVAGAEPAAHHLTGQRVRFDPVAQLAGRAEAVFRVRVRAKAVGDWRFKAYLNCDQLQRPVYAEESTQVYDGGDPGKAEDIPKRQQ